MKDHYSQLNTRAIDKAVVTLLGEDALEPFQKLYAALDEMELQGRTKGRDEGWDEGYQAGHDAGYHFCAFEAESLKDRDWTDEDYEAAAKADHAEEMIYEAQRLAKADNLPPMQEQPNYHSPKWDSYKW